MTKSRWILLLLPLAVLGVSLWTTGGVGLFSALGRAAAPAEDAAPSPEVAAQLEALGYVDWTSYEDAPELARAGVTRHDPLQTQPGLNLFTSLPRDEAHLIDMAGRIVHTWTGSRHAAGAWSHVELTPRGELFALKAHRPLEKLGWNSEVLWTSPVEAHHDLDVYPDGRIVTLGQEIRPVRLHARRTRILDNSIAILSAEGELLREIWLSSLFGERVPEKVLDEIDDYLAEHPEPDPRKYSPLDVFHANAVEILDRDVEGLGPEGSLLVSMRSLDLIAVVDPDKGEPAVLWSWGEGVLDRQHHPTLLDDGNLLVFDNGWHRRRSRVIELEPRTGRVVWKYGDEPGQHFFTKRRGGSQQLANGNVLVADAENGRAFEVTRGGELVWEFFNPDVEAEEGRRAGIYRMHRVPAGVLVAIEGRLAAAPGAPQ